MSNSKKIILCPNAERDKDYALTGRVLGLLEKCGRHAVVCPVFDNGALTRTPARGVETADLETELTYAEMIITFGGDGTILRAARAAAGYSVPVLGVNIGGKGFMAELEIEDIGLITAAAGGDYRIDSRMMLDVEVLRDGNAVANDFALNDVVIKGDNKVIDLTLLGDGQKISYFYGDGVIVATPTGSTAYSMAAGGPIVEPAAHNIIVTPICAHVLQAKSFVLVSDRHVSVEIENRKRNLAYMSVDGGDHVDIQSGDVINVRKSERSTHFVRLSNMSFYTKVGEKLGEKA